MLGEKIHQNELSILSPVTHQAGCSSLTK